MARTLLAVVALAVVGLGIEARADPPEKAPAKPGREPPISDGVKKKPPPAPECFKDVPQDGVYELQLTSVPGGEYISQNRIKQCDGFPTGKQFQVRLEVDLSGGKERITTLSPNGTIRDIKLQRAVLPGCAEQGVTEKRVMGMSWVEYGARKEGSEFAWQYHVAAMKTRHGGSFLDINAFLVDRRDGISCYARLNSE